MTDSEIKKSPVVWMAVYQAAVKRGDTALAARAKRELKKAGIILTEREDKR
jgi:hypothetical protein